MLNYNLIAADYYFDKGNYDARKRTFLEIMKWQSKSNLNSKELVDLAKSLCFQDQYAFAIKLLKPQLNKDEIDKEVLFYFLQIAIYDEYLVPEKFYLEKMLLAFQLFPDDVCELFSKSKMGIQALKKLEIKEIYCSNCQP